eukprot:g10319.t1
MLGKRRILGLDGVSDPDVQEATPLTNVAGDGAEIGGVCRGTINVLLAAKSRNRLVWPLCVVVVGLGVSLIVRYFVTRDRDVARDRDTARGRDTARDRDTGPIFPSNPDCPYILRTPQERSSQRDPSIPGNFLHVQNFNYGRMGNRFGSLSQNLRLGYCCQSKLVCLPPKDDTLAPGVLSGGTPGPRWFDFTDAPDVAGFNASSCPATIEWSSRNAFRLDGLDNPTHLFYTPNLVECIKSVPRLVGCEAAYFFPMDIDICQSEQTSASNASLEEHPNNESSATGMEFEGEEAPENLVIHIRSGDIFTKPHPKYGQPPLQFYLRAIEHRNWGRVDVVTNGNTDISGRNGSINPVVTALEEVFGDGELQNIYFHKDRTFEEDLLSMLCTNGGLVTARSTMARPLTYLSAASRVYFSFRCHDVLDNVEHMPSGRKRHKQVFHAIYSEPLMNYSPYRHWNATLYQISEMLTFPVVGFEDCANCSAR